MPATGRPCPAFSAAVPAYVEQLTPFDYRNPDQLADGGVLVVGASATGVQLAAEIRRSGRPVTLSVGEHVRLPRTYRGRDVLWWMDASGVWDERYDEVDDLDPRPTAALAAARRHARARAPSTSTPLTDLGVELVGRWAAVRDGRALFSGGLRNVFSLADLKMQRLLDTFDEWALRQRRTTPTSDPPERLEPTRVPDTTRLQLDLSSGEIRTIVWATGFRPDYTLARRARPRREGAPAPRRRRASRARASTRWGCRCCGGASPRSSTASRTTPAR